MSRFISRQLRSLRNIDHDGLNLRPVVGTTTTRARRHKLGLRPNALTSKRFTGVLGPSAPPRSTGCRWSGATPRLVHLMLISPFTLIGTWRFASSAGRSGRSNWGGSPSAITTCHPAPCTQGMVAGMARCSGARHRPAAANPHLPLGDPIFEGILQRTVGPQRPAVSGRLLSRPVSPPCCR